MAKPEFDVQKLATAGGVGLLSSYLAANDFDAIAKGKRLTVWKQWENIGAVGITALGYVMQYAGLKDEIGKDISQAGMVLVGKAIGEEYIFKKKTGRSSTNPISTYVQRVNELPIYGVNALGPTEIYDKIVRPRRGI